MDNHQGFKICIGSDGQGFCGGMKENMLREFMHMLFIMNDVSTHELFSPQYALSTSLQTTQHAGWTGVVEIQL